MEPRLKSRLWIAAEIRRCAVADIVAVVARRGDPDLWVLEVEDPRSRFTLAETVA